MYQPIPIIIFRFHLSTLDVCILSLLSIAFFTPMPRLTELAIMFVSMKSSCGRVDTVIDSHTTGPGFKPLKTLPTELLTDYHHISIIKLSVRCCVLKVGEGFPNRV